MTETAAAGTPEVLPKKKSGTKKSVKAKKAPGASHPKYIDMVAEAIRGLKERSGSSRQAIVKYIMSNYKVGDDSKHINSRVKIALRSGAAKGILKQVKGTGASGSFRVMDKAPPKATKKVTKKSATPVTPKKTLIKKKKTPVKKTPKKPATTPKKSTLKKAARKTPKKATPKKKPVKKVVKKTPKKKATPKK